MSDDSEYAADLKKRLNVYLHHGTCIGACILELEKNKADSMAIGIDILKRELRKYREENKELIEEYRIWRRDRVDVVRTGN